MDPWLFHEILQCHGLQLRKVLCSYVEEYFKLLTKTGSKMSSFTRLIDIDKLLLVCLITKVRGM